MSWRGRRKLGLLGEGTLPGLLLGNEPNGLALDPVADLLLIRDETGAKSYFGSYATRCPSGSITTAELPIFSRSAGSVYCRGTVPASGFQCFASFYYSPNEANGRFSFINSANNTMGAIYRSGGSTVVTGAGASASSGSHRYTFRWLTNDFAMFRDGVVDATDNSCATPSFTPDILKFFKDRDDTSPWTNAKLGFAWVPRAMNDAELARWSAP
jgi:hypothetical protein